MYLYTPDIDIINIVLSATKLDNDILDKYKSLKVNNTVKTKNSNVTFTFSSSTPVETIDKKKKNLQKYKNERRTPGEQTASDSNYIIDKTLCIVIY